jgi:dGTPase
MSKKRRICPISVCRFSGIATDNPFKTFRRLKHKTQVFLSLLVTIRTRLTHVLEVSQRWTIASALCSNEPLTRPLLGRDLGHTPPGHAGEATLNDCIRAVSDIMCTVRVVDFRKTTARD